MAKLEPNRCSGAAADSVHRITTNENTMPWPTEAMALARAKADAEMEGEREGIKNFPVIALKKEAV